MRKVFISIIIIACTSACKKISSLSNSSGPIYHQNTFLNTASNKDVINVMSFNTQKALQIDKSVNELKQSIDFNNCEVLFLQEVTHAAVKLMADNFKLNYTFIPFSEDNNIKYGTAILSKYKLEDPIKTIFESKKINGRIRGICYSKIVLENKCIHLMSIHTETIVMSKRKRLDQISEIVEFLNEVNDEEDAVIIGGDFNTLSAHYLSRIDLKVNQIGLIRVTKNLNFTAKALNRYCLNLDHIYARGVECIDSKKLESSNSSDHLPIKSILRLPKN